MMSDPTICKNCKYCHWFEVIDSIHVTQIPPRCTAGCCEGIKTNFVTGDTTPTWDPEPVRCELKNTDGDCPDYKASGRGFAEPPEPLFKIVQDEPRKYWWQK